MISLHGYLSISVRKEISSASSYPWPELDHMHDSRPIAVEAEESDQIVIQVQPGTDVLSLQSSNFANTKSGFC